MDHATGPDQSDRGPWPGSFVSSSSGHGDRRRPAPYFRKAFLAGPGLRRASLHITALGLIEGYVNGRRVGDDVLCPGWTSYRHRILVSSHDVTDLVHEGANVLGSIAGEGWAVGRLGWEGKRAFWSDRPAAYMHLQLDYGDRLETVSTDRSWRTSTGAVLEDGIYDGETYDARLEPDGWATADFDDSGWEPVELLDWDLSTLEAATVPPIRRTEELPVRELITTPSGQSVADFGQVISGWVRLVVDGPAGSTVTLRHCELLVDGEPEYETLRSAAATDSYTLRGGGAEIWEPRFTFHGFRYTVVDGWPGRLEPASLSAVAVNSDLVRTGWFECSDERVNQLHRNVVWSFRGNAVGIPTDCPQRDERLGWTGDINAFAPSAAFIYDVSGFLGSWLRDLALEQEAQGGVPWVVPDVLGPASPTALWGDAAISVPWILYHEYGDEGALRSQYPSMKAFAEAVIPALDERGLWTSGLQLGDWLDPDSPPDDPGGSKTEAALVANAYLHHALEQLESVARVLGIDSDVRQWSLLRSRVLQAFCEEWVTPSGRMANETQTAYALAICFGLLDDTQTVRAGRRLADLVAGAGFHIGTGFAGTPWLLHALTNTGQADCAYRLLAQTSPPSFLYPVTMGATTVWERWDAVLPDGRLNSTGMTSLNHYAFGSVADWLHKVVGGLAATEAGYRSVTIAPEPGGGISWARMSHDTPMGRISVAWRTTGPEMTLDVVLPDALSAKVVLPGHADRRTETVCGGAHTWTYPVAEGSWGRFGLDTPIAVLRSDEDVWERVVDVIERFRPGSGQYMAHIGRRYPNLGAVVAAAGDEPETLRDALLEALRSAGGR